MSISRGIGDQGTFGALPFSYTELKFPWQDSNLHLPRDKRWNPDLHHRLKLILRAARANSFRLRPENARATLRIAARELGSRLRARTPA